MAETLTITSEKNGTQIIIDGNQINDVVSYTLQESTEGAKLTLEIFVTGKIEVQR